MVACEQARHREGRQFPMDELPNRCLSPGAVLGDVTDNFTCVVEIPIAQFVVRGEEK